MLDNYGVTVLYSLLRATPEERKAFWKDLEQWAIDNEYYPGFYCPYIPLQMVNTKEDKMGENKK